MARDKGVPLSRVFQALSDYTRTPVNAVWVMAALAFLLGLPLLYSSTAFSAIASISSVGLFVSCESPCQLSVTSLSAVRAPLTIFDTLDLRFPLSKRHCAAQRAVP